MKLSPIADWTSLYYDVVEHYFWEPQLIGRTTTADSHEWSFWRAKLGRLEVPLNHILLQFFALAPQEMIDCALSSLSVGTYATMSAALRGHAATDPTAGRLRDGLLAELDRRGLSDRPEGGSSSAVVWANRSRDKR